MEALKIRIQTLEDLGKERLAMPELKDKTFHRVKDMTVCIIEDMTTEHKAGVSFVFEHADGTYSSHLVTENLMNGMIASFKGALQRFEYLRKERLKNQN